MLEARELTVWRGDTRLFEGVSFRVAPGEGLLLRGPNGSGKTTLLRVLCGLTLPEQGQVSWRGETQACALRGLAAYAAHQPGLNLELTVRQNLEFYARIGAARAALERVLAELGLARCAELEVRRLSAGQRRRAALARVVMSGSPVWLLDEPFANLDAAGRRLLEQRLGTHLASGGIAVVAGHEDILDGRLATLTLSEADT